MATKIISSEALKSKQWSGGTTTQLFIFPPDADYQKRNFQFRLSTATVETEQSAFTSLNGISRKLMILDGEIILSHENQSSKPLHKFDIAEFDGDWKTTSIGKCTDFNLMLAGTSTGNISAMQVHKNQKNNCRISMGCHWFFIYLYIGKIKLKIGDELISINKGDLLALSQPSISNLEIYGMEFCELVTTEVWL